MDEYELKRFFLEIKTSIRQKAEKEGRLSRLERGKEVWEVSADRKLNNASHEDSCSL